MSAICVYCSSSSNLDPIFTDIAEQTGRLIAERAGTLVFGGNDLGMMKSVADSAREAGGNVVGITTRLLDGHGCTYHNADELIIADTMRQRKQMMEDRADGFLTLPGGFGTLEELFEIITHRMLGYHDKPVAILNTQDFYTPLSQMFDHLYEQGFARDKCRASYTFVQSPQQALDHLLAGCQV